MMLHLLNTLLMLYVIANLCNIASRLHRNDYRRIDHVIVRSTIASRSLCALSLSTVNILSGDDVPEEIGSPNYKGSSLKRYNFYKIYMGSPLPLDEMQKICRDNLTKQ